MTSDELGMALVYIQADAQRALKALDMIPANLVTSPIGEAHRDLQRAVAFLGNALLTLDEKGAG